MERSEDDNRLLDDGDKNMDMSEVVVNAGDGEAHGGGDDEERNRRDGYYTNTKQFPNE